MAATLPTQGDAPPWGSTLVTGIREIETRATGLYCEKAADQTLNSSSATDISSLTMTLVTGTRYDFEFFVPYTGDTNASAPISLYVQGPTGSFISYWMYIQNSSSGKTEVVKTAFNSVFTGAAVTTAGTTYVAWIRGRIVTTAGGALKVQGGTDGTRTNAVKGGAYGTARWVG